MLHRFLSKFYFSFRSILVVLMFLTLFSFARYSRRSKYLWPILLDLAGKRLTQITLYFKCQLTSTVNQSGINWNLATQTFVWCHCFQVAPLWASWEKDRVNNYGLRWSRFLSLNKLLPSERKSTDNVNHNMRCYYVQTSDYGQIIDLFAPFTYSIDMILPRRQALRNTTFVSWCRYSNKRLKRLAWESVKSVWTESVALHRVYDV